MMTKKDRDLFQESSSRKESDEWIEKDRLGKNLATVCMSGLSFTRQAPEIAPLLSEIVMQGMAKNQ